MALPYSFSNNTTPTGPQLDADLAQLGAQSTIPCAVAGTNALVLTPQTNTSAIAAYANYLRFSGIAAATNTAATTAQIGSLAALPCYRDTLTGPAICTGGELAAGCAFSLVYDSALNSGNGGFHITSQTSDFSTLGGTVNGNIVVTNGTLTSYLTPASISNNTLLATTASITALRMGASATITRMNSALATLTYTLVPANSEQTQIMACVGAQTLDVISLGVSPSYPAQLAVKGNCTANGTLSIAVFNVTNASVAGFTMTVHALAIGATP